MKSQKGEFSLRQLKWLAITVPILFVGTLEAVVYFMYPSLLSWPGRIVMAAVILVGLVFFWGGVFDVLGQMQSRLARQNRELEALHRAAIDIYGELALDTVLTKVVDQARQLLDARYGAVSVIDVEGAIQEFVTSGIDPHVEARIGDPPVGRGLLGVVLHEGRHLRIEDMGKDSRRHGFPEHHPEMRSLLAVPIVCKGPFRGNLYVAEKTTQDEFSAEDEETLVRFATEASIAIDNAHLNSQLRHLAVAEERALLAREMHDGMAQVLAYVNTKAQAVRAYLRNQKVEEAGEQLDQLAAAAREVYTDVREGILALRSQPELGESFYEALSTFLDRWREQSGVTAELTMDPEIVIPSRVELQLLRIVQEALSNVRKHSGATLAYIELRRENDMIVAEVRDDGSGFDPEHRELADLPRFGLAIMRERAEGIGGSLELVSSAGNGTRVRAELPLSASESA
ncbi:MAG: GAF domain-containing protein [Acidimicrobiia bacterium]